MSKSARQLLLAALRLVGVGARLLRGGVFEGQTESDSWPPAERGPISSVPSWGRVSAEQLEDTVALGDQIGTHDPDVLHFVREVVTRRDCGNPWVRSGQRRVLGDMSMSAREAADVFVERLGLGAIGESWLVVRRSEARRIVVNVLHQDLAYDSENMPLAVAEALADRFMVFVDRDAQFLTNGSLGLRDPLLLGEWSPVTSATFDTGVMAVGSQWIVMFWVEDED